MDRGISGALERAITLDRDWSSQKFTKKSLQLQSSLLQLIQDYHDPKSAFSEKSPVNIKQLGFFLIIVRM